MIARHVSLGRAVIVAGGLLVVAALTSVVVAGRPGWMWAAVFAASVLGFMGLLVLGRAGGALAASRLGGDRRQGERWGIGLAIGLPAAALTLSRWLGWG